MSLEEKINMNVNLIVKTTDVKKKMVKVRFRLLDGRRNDLFVKSEISVDIRFWDNDNESYRNVKACPYSLAEQKAVKDSIANRKMLIEDIYLKVKDNGTLTSKKFNEYVNATIKYGSATALNVDLLTVQMQEYIKDKGFSTSKIKSTNTNINTILRYERYKSLLTGVEYKTLLSGVNRQWLKDFKEFIEKEMDIIVNYPELYPDKKIVRSFSVRCDNYVNEVLTRLRSFWNWALAEEKVSHNPFAKFDIEQPVNGDPIVLTKNEILTIYKSKVVDDCLAKVKAVFLLCSFVGCRISELDRMTKANNLIEKEVDGVKIKCLEYYQTKGARKRIFKITTPLNHIALEMINNYYFETGRVMPKISISAYNENLKRLFETIGLTRDELLFDRRTGKEKRVPISQLVSSHMGRRNLLSMAANSGADKSVYTSITGHKINTPHLNRYIKVETSTKKDLLDGLCIVNKYPAMHTNQVG
jgi:integrase